MSESEDFDFEDKDSEEDSDEQESHLSSSTSSKTRSRNLSRSYKNGLPDYIVKQLLLDIESSGGRFASTARKLSNKQPDLYGRPGTRDRTKVRNKFNYLRTLSDKEYFELLRNFGCLPHSLSKNLRLTPSHCQSDTTKERTTKKDLGTPPRKTSTLQYNPSILISPNKEPLIGAIMSSKKGKRGSDEDLLLDRKYKNETNRLVYLFLLSLSNYLLFNL
jgi:hypothetical protein